MYLVDNIIFGYHFGFYLSIFVDVCPGIGGKIGWKILYMVMELNEDYINLIENHDDWMLMSHKVSFTWYATQC